MADRTTRSWIDDEIRAARAAGKFDHLARHGQPLPGLDKGYDPMWWVKQLLEREKVSLLPGALEIRVKVERELARVQTLAHEAEVRAAVSALNREIAQVNRTTTAGPSTTIAILDVDAVVAQWRAQRPQR